MVHNASIKSVLIDFIYSYQLKGYTSVGRLVVSPLKNTSMSSCLHSSLMLISGLAVAQEERTNKIKDKRSIFFIKQMYNQSIKRMLIQY